MLSIHRLLKVACPLAAFSVPLVWFTIDNHMERERERSSDIVESMFKPSKLAACMIHSRMKTCWPAVGNMSCLWLHGSWELIVCCFKSFLGGMTWLVATIFDSTQFKVCMCKLVRKKVIGSKAQPVQPLHGQWRTFVLLEEKSLLWQQNILGLPFHIQSAVLLALTFGPLPWEKLFYWCDKNQCSLHSYYKLQGTKPFHTLLTTFLKTL